MAAFGKTEGDAGRGGAGIAKAFAELKLPGSLVSEITSVAEFSKSIASSAREAAVAWRQMAEAARAVRTAQAPGAGGTGGGGTGGGGGGRGGGGGPGNSIFGTPEERANAKVEDQLRTAAKNYPIFGTEREQQEAKLYNSLIDAETRAAAAALRKAEAEERSAAAATRAAAVYENTDRNLIASKKEAAANKKFADDHALAKIENDNRDRIAKEQAGKPLGHQDWSLGATGFQLAGQGGMSFFEKAIMTNFQYQQEMLPFSLNSSVSDADRVAIDERSKELTREVPGTTRQGNVQNIAELWTLTNDLKASMEASKVYAQMTQVYESIPGLHQGDHAFASMQSLELMQRFYDPDTHKISTDEVMKGMIAEARVAIGTRGRASPEDYRAMAKQSRAAGMLASDEFLYEDLPAAMIALGGSRAGTAMAGGYREFARGTMTKPVAADLKKFGILDDKATWSGGRVQNMDQHLIGFKTFQQDQIKWVQEYLLPALSKHGVDTNDRAKLEAALTPLASTNVVLGALSEFAVGMEGIKKEKEKLKQTSVDATGKPVNPIDQIIKNSPLVQLREFQAAQNELMLAVGKLLQGPAVGMLKELVVELNHLTDWIEAHKAASKNLAEGLLVMSGLSLGIGNLALALMLLKPMIGVLNMMTGGIFKLGGAAAGAGAAGAGAGAGARSIMWGGGVIPGLVAAGTYAGYQGSKMTGEDIARHGEQGQTPLMMDEFGHPMGYYTPTPKAESLVTPPVPTTGSADNPTHVFVQNQISEAGLSRGVASNMASRGARPGAGYTGADTRMDLLGVYAGVGGP